MPDFGIGELIAGLGGLEGGLGGLGSLFGLGEAAAAPALAAGGAEAGVGAAEAGSALGFADLFGAGGATANALPAFGATADALPAFGATADALSAFGATADALPAFGTNAGAVANGFADLGGGPTFLGNVLATGPAAESGAVAAPAAAQVAGGSVAGAAAPAGIAAAPDWTSAVASAVGPEGGAEGAGGALSGIKDSLLGKNAGWLSALGPAAGAAGLGLAMTQNNKQLPSTEQIQQRSAAEKAQAAPLIAEGTQFSNYLPTGTLPPGLQAQVDQQVKDKKIAIKSRYASMGLPADPMQNSTLQAELQQVDSWGQQQVAALGENLSKAGSGLINSGANLTGMSDNLLTTLSGIDRAQADAIGKAIANFAAAVGSTTKKPGVTVSA